MVAGEEEAAEASPSDRPLDGLAVQGEVESIVRSGGRVYLGGSFSEVGGEPHQNVAAVGLESAAPLPRSADPTVLVDHDHVGELDLVDQQVVEAALARQPPRGSFVAVRATREPRVGGGATGLSANWIHSH